MINVYFTYVDLVISFLLVKRIYRIFIELTILKNVKRVAALL
jgi:hypothetical protein